MLRMFFSNRAEVASIRVASLLICSGMVEGKPVRVNERGRNQQFPSLDLLGLVAL
jgi:hypothetical protein